VRQAQGGENLADAASQKAAEEVLTQYQQAIRAYLLGALRDAEAVDEVYQQFALKFVRQDFHAADPAKGRFRDLIKRSLINLVNDYWKRKARDRQLPLGDSAERASPPADDLGEKLKADMLRSLLDSAWVKLSKSSNDSGPPYFEALRLRRENPDVSSERIARQLTRLLHPDKPFTADQVRQILRRAREKFADIVVYEVCRVSGATNKEALRAELADLDLLEICHEAVDRTIA
jgi:DNA-directed RNA polymerase specialized sigma24 family protein